MLANTVPPPLPGTPRPHRAAPIEFRATGASVDVLERTLVPTAHRPSARVAASAPVHALERARRVPAPRTGAAKSETSGSGAGFWSRFVLAVGAGLIGLTAACACLPPARPEPVQAVVAQNPAVSEARWEDSLAAMRRQFGHPDGGLRELHGLPERATAWPYGQAMAAELDAALLTGDYRHFEQLARDLDDYRSGPAYAAVSNGRSGQGDRFFDDNATLGLVFIQAYQQRSDPAYLQRARDLYEFNRSGLREPGLIVWHENDSHDFFGTEVQALNIELGLRLFLATREARYRQEALQLYDLTNRHLSIREGPARGLFYDKLDTQFRPDESLGSDWMFTYTQGAMAGANVLLYRITGEDGYLNEAHRIAHASLNYFEQEDRMWSQPPAFNAIFFRNLLALDAVSGDTSYEKALDQYLERAWRQARNPSTGLFDPAWPGGPLPIGQYDATRGPRVNLLDQAALTQLYALARWPREERVNVS